MVMGGINFGSKCQSLMQGNYLCTKCRYEDQEEKNMKYAVVISSGDAETIWNAFRFATSALIYENDVTVFLLGKSVEATTVGTLKYDVNEQMGIYRESGGTLIGCGVCCENRKDTMPLIEEQLNCELGSMQTLYVLVQEADKVLTF